MRKVVFLDAMMLDNFEIFFLRFPLKAQCLLQEKMELIVNHLWNPCHLIWIYRQIWLEKKKGRCFGLGSMAKTLTASSSQQARFFSQLRRC